MTIHDVAIERAATSAAAHRLDPLLKPASIAYMGASTRPNTPGNAMIRAALRDGYKGEVFAINKKYPSVEGIACHPDLASLPRTVDHVVLGVANEHLESGLAQAIRHGARAVTIFASCNLPGHGDSLARRLQAMAREAGIVICGGNSMGFANPPLGLVVSGYMAKHPLAPGGIAFITQSGSAFSALAYNDRRLKFSAAISSGRELTVTTADYIDWALAQKETRAIGLFLETARDPENFAASLAAAERRHMPVVVLKVGRTEMSAAFAASHSGAIAGDNAAYDALFSKYGVLTANTLDELAANLLLFGGTKRPGPGGLASIHDSGGEREMVADLAQRTGVPFARISSETRVRMAAHLDDDLKPDNPLDAWGTGRDFETHVEACLEALIEDSDTAIGVMFQDIRTGSYVAEGFTNAAIRVSRRSPKPVAVVANYSALDHRELALAVTEAGVPVIDGTAEGLMAIRNLLAFRDHLPSAPPGRPSNPAQAKWRARLSSGTPLSESEGLALIADYGIRVPRHHWAEKLEDVLAAARSIGFPVALKTASPGILHKSDKQGVVLGITDETALTAAYHSMAQRLGPQVLVAEMAAKGVELALGLVHDAQFGPYLMVAAGGVWIEVLKDRTVAMPPLDSRRATALVDGLHIRPLLDGRRGAAPADLASLAASVMSLSAIAEELGDLIGEMDINPLIVSPSGAVAVDALVIPQKRTP
ncbi:acetate--CoA ligase family protein [Taklimakanibacter lacteus]|uniref:acetate--CoA ligase family protein n=1 Tax=Taklimakanibacter lacteus TaxID=2268456 RepID=UPI000E6630B2